MISRRQEATRTGPLPAHHRTGRSARSGADEEDRDDEPSKSMSIDSMWWVEAWRNRVPAGDEEVEKAVGSSRARCTSRKPPAAGLVSDLGHPRGEGGGQTASTALPPSARISAPAQR
jgi:hypothetical protein